SLPGGTWQSSTLLPLRPQGKSLQALPSILQSDEQPSPDTVFPSSHSSLDSRISSPQNSTENSTVWQLASHVFVLGGSPCSPGCTIPLPHAIGIVWHCLSQVAPSGGSHCSRGSTVPSPHTPCSIAQVGEQPSPGRVLASSHPSPGSTAPLPHTAGGGASM